MLTTSLVNNFGGSPFGVSLIGGNLDDGKPLTLKKADEILKSTAGCFFVVIIN